MKCRPIGYEKRGSDGKKENENLPPPKSEGDPSDQVPPVPNPDDTPIPPVVETPTQNPTDDPSNTPPDDSVNDQEKPPIFETPNETPSETPSETPTESPPASENVEEDNQSAILAYESENCPGNIRIKKMIECNDQEKFFDDINCVCVDPGAPCLDDDLDAKLISEDGPADCSGHTKFLAAIACGDKQGDFDELTCQCQTTDETV